MKSAVEHVGPTRVKLTVDVPFEELKPSLDAAYATIASQVQVPGFRQGKVPARIIDQRVGRGAVVQEAVNEALPQFYSDAVDQQELQPIGQPEVDVTAVPAADGDDLSFTVEVDVVPDFELPAFEDVTVEVDPVSISDEDVDTELDALRERFGTVAAVDRAAQDGDTVNIGLRAEINGEEIDDVAAVDYLIGAGNMLEGLDEAVIGLSAGDTKNFTSPLIGGEHEGEDADITVTVNSVSERTLPELDDDFATTVSGDYENLAELRSAISEQVERGKKMEQGIQARDKVLDQLLETLDLPVPEALVESEVHSHLEGEERLEDDEHRAEVTESTRKQLQTQFVLDRIARDEKVEVGQQDLIEFIIASAGQYGLDPNQFAQMLDQQGQIPAIMGEVGRRKALAAVLEKVTIKDTTGAVVDLNALDTEFEDEVDGAVEDLDLDEAELDDAGDIVAEEVVAEEVVAGADDEDESTPTA
ncbi:trigger factor [Branchiibius hedensis]|uniref:Trigger factor n=1 Tax=Branchiibius hedensis TaxID=672460 RepID=A0A2Y8ZN82_9MICO|nr:trigger factor [Branchiibius hedensis]PWJ24598.1 trigger factor [Branchiibius hedensis]SSA33415.1 trigger factor [Branchiibius hedensis]